MSTRVSRQWKSRLICSSVLFQKLANYTGSSLKNLVASSSTDENDKHCFRLIGSRVFWMPLALGSSLPVA